MPFSTRAYLIHVSHYDPRWCELKEQEKPFEIKVGLDIVNAMAKEKMNTLIIDCEDGVEYSSHPELKRHYTVKMQDVKQLADFARSKNIDVIPKINFSRSHRHCHNDWFRPHDSLFDTDKYWEIAFEVIDELISELKPEKFFHIGMDEDHTRSYTQYVTAINTLHAGLTKRGLRTVIWNDSACEWPTAQIHQEKSMFAERTIPKDIVQILWDYVRSPSTHIKRIRHAGFELWGAPGDKLEQVKEMKNDLLESGATGFVLTRWKHCIAENRDLFVKHIETFGKLAVD